MKLPSLIAATALIFASTVIGQTDAPKPKKKKVNPAMVEVQDVEGLPRVLLIGDSISIGYTVPVRKGLEGKANVHRPLTNCGPTTNGVANLDKWLGDKPWDVIHFNWGLHDLKYMGKDGKNLADPEAEGSHRQVSPEDYEANLKELVNRLKKTNAKLIWRNTTPVPEGAAGRIPGHAEIYNGIAAQVMDANQIPVQDMFSFVEPRIDEIMLPRNVHFTPEGSQKLADEVVKEIEAALKE